MSAALALGFATAPPVASSLVVAPCVAGGLTPGGEVAAAQESAATQAGLVIDYGDGRIERRCVPLDDGETVDPLVLLERSGSGVVVEDFGGGQLTICRVDGVGCDHPDEPCFCACEDPSAECRFWGLYIGDLSSWSFSETGVAGTTVRAGDVIAWRWGDHGEGGSPPAAPSAGLCPAGQAAGGSPAAIPESGSDGVPVAGLAVAGVVAAGLIALAVARSRRAPKEGE